MLSHKDIDYRQFVLVNSMDTGHELSVSKGNAIIKDDEGNTLTKLSKQKVLAIMVIGHCTFTTPLADFCHKNSIALIAVNSRLRPTFFISRFSEGNFLLRQRQHRVEPEMALYYSRHIVACKIFGHISQLKSVRKKSDEQSQAIQQLEGYYHDTYQANALDVLMGVEGNAAKLYFKNYFVNIQGMAWQGRKPRLKIDPINVVLDMGYTLLFNFVEVVVRLFGFDVYVGVLHQLWYQRKSLICDLVEPFRCIVEKQVVKSFRLGQFDSQHFSLSKSQYYLERKHYKSYYSILTTAIVEQKEPIFAYIRDYYRAFMKQSIEAELPVFYFNETKLP